jgi:protein-S-isoprenylcysteine O-methyltransferase Ste14
MSVTGRVPAPTHDGPRVLRIPPPLYYAAAFAAGMLLRGATVPFDIGARPATAVLGGGVFVAGAAMALAGVAEVVRHRTTIVPHHMVSALVTTGVYRLSRNPMYTGLAILYVGGALLVGSWWPVLTLPVALLAVRRIVIDPEERYLASHFAPTYAAYRARVRRWL